MVLFSGHPFFRVDLFSRQNGVVPYDRLAAAPA